MPPVTPIKQIVNTESPHQILNRIYLLSQTVNGGIDFGNSAQLAPGAYSGNISGQWVRVTAPVTPNTTFTVPHTLGRVPSAYFYNTDRAAIVFGLPGTFGTWTQTSVFLQCSVASAVLNIFVT